MGTKFIKRSLEPIVMHHLNRGKSLLLLGPRQVGKTTLLSKIKSDFSVSFVDRKQRLQYERNPETLAQELATLKSKKPLVIIDEVQRVPEIMDVAQSLIDANRAQFILTGSSARKLKRHADVNLLPGRVVSLRLDPLSCKEINLQKIELADLLNFGSLPSLYLTADKKDQDQDLSSYVETYLEEEVRREALVRRLGPFSRFLELAALGSGQIINYRSLASELGVDKNTVTSYFEILFDCLIAERIDPITKSQTRKKMTKSSRYVFFDLGVRRSAARQTVISDRNQLGPLFEQWVALELIRLLRLTKPRAKLNFWRDPGGPEVDWVVDIGGELTPIEVKLTESPTLRDARHLKTFLYEYPSARVGYVICSISRPQKLSDQITALPWQQLAAVIGE